MKNKQSGGETPVKNRTPTKFGHPETSSKRRMSNGKSDNVKDSNAESQPFCDLWSEAKKAAEVFLNFHFFRACILDAAEKSVYLHFWVSYAIQ